MAMNLTRTAKSALWIITISIVLGTIGFSVFSGHSLWEAFYSTMAIFLSQSIIERPESRVLQIMVIFIVIGSYFALALIIKWFIETVLGGTIGESIRRRRMEKTIADLADHYIVCGFGRIGKQVAEELSDEKLPFVVIELKKEEEPYAIEKGWNFILGDSREESVLKQAGVERAKGLIATLGSDADNVFVTLATRSLNKDVVIVARANDTHSESKLLESGATRVALPYVMGGYYMGTMAIRPAAANFCDIVMDTKHQELNIEELDVREGSNLAGKKIDEALQDPHGVTVLAVNRGGKNIINPNDDFELMDNDQLIVMGDKQKLQEALSKFK